MCRHWKEIYSDFLSVDNHPEESKILAVEEITVKNPRTFKDERVLALYLQGESKPLILCATNCRDLERIAKSGKHSDWIGLEI